MSVAIDPRGADSRRAQADILAGPLASGFVIERLALANGIATLDQAADDVSVLARLTQDLGPHRLVVAAKIGSGAAAAQVTLEFETYSCAGTALLVRRRGPIGAAKLNFAFTVTRDGQAVAVADLAQWLEIDGLRGNVGHIALLLSFEHQRLRRHLAAAAAARTLDGCNGGLLDQLGAELGVPRLESRLQFAGGILSGVSQSRETDASFRSRLASYRARIFPTPPALRSRLRGVHPQLGLEERTVGFEGTYRLIAFGQTLAEANAARVAALDSMRKNILIDPGSVAVLPANADAAQISKNALRDAIREGYAVAPGQSRPLAPALARALDRLRKFLSAVGYAGAISLEQGQADDAGSRYELGLGARLAVSATFAADLSAKVAAANPASTGPFAAALTRHQAMPEEARNQIEALLAISGLSTAIMLDATHVYVSHLLTGTMEIDGPGAVALAPDGTGQATFTARETAPLDGVGLGQALAAAQAIAAVSAGPIGGPDLINAFANLPAHLSSYAARIVAPRFSLVDQSLLGAQLQTAAPDRLAGLRLKPALAAKVVAGDEAAWDALVELSFSLADQGIPALAVVVTTAGAVLLAASSAPLPGLGANLTLQRNVARAWAKADLTGGTRGTFGADRGETFTLHAQTPGLWCVALSSYRRMGQPDPAEVRPTLPEGVEIDYETYERMMNLLQLARPLGVEINTWRIRQRHVRLDPAAPLAALNLSAARSYRRFRQARFAHPLDTRSQGD